MALRTQGPKRKEGKGTGDICLMTSFLICIPRHILLQLYGQCISWVEEMRIAYGALI
jgi:hypothetical protein